MASTLSLSASLAGLFDVLRSAFRPTGCGSFSEVNLEPDLVAITTWSRMGARARPRALHSRTSVNFSVSKEVTPRSTLPE